MPITDVSICNSALLKVGAELISSLEENNKRARICKEQYDKIRDDVLRSHPWNFAIRRLALSRTLNTPAFEFMYEYNLPTGCLRVLSTYPENTKYVVEGGKLLCNTETISIKYILKVTDTNLYDPNFVEAFALRLASEISYPIVQSTSLKQSLLQEYQLFMQDARTYNGQEGTPEELFDDTFLNARVSGPGWGYEVI